MNGQEFPEHFGGNTQILRDITSALRPPQSGPTSVSLLVKTMEFKGLPQGKQLAKAGFYSEKKQQVPTLYSNITGIWQSVWIEAVPFQHHIARAQMAPESQEKTWHLRICPEISTPDLDPSIEPLLFEAFLYRSRDFSGKPITSGRLILEKKSNGSRPSLRLKVAWSSLLLLRSSFSPRPKGCLTVAGFCELMLNTKRWPL